MNTLTKSFAKRALSMLLVVIMVFSLGIVGITSASAAEVELAETGGTNWYGNIYFLAPEGWDIDKNTVIQIDLVQNDSASSANYNWYVGTMGRIGNSRLFHYYIGGVDHGSWNKEYITFTANSSAWKGGEQNQGDHALTGHTHYTDPLDYQCNNSQGYYLFVPKTGDDNSKTKNNAMSGNWTNNRDMTKATQTVNITTDGVSSATGGSVTMSGSYLSADTTLANSSSTSTGASIEYGACQGSSMKLTATPSTGYKFSGWYDGSTFINSDLTYTYNVFGAKTITAKFEKDASITNVTATVEGTPVVNKPVTLNVSYEATGVTDVDVELLDGNNVVTSTYDAETGKLTFTPTTSGKQNYTVKVSGNNVSGTASVTVDVLAELYAKIAADTDETYYGYDVNVAVVSNGKDYGDDVTYTLYYSNDTVYATNDTGNFVVNEDDFGKYTYYATVEVNGFVARSDSEITINFKDRVFSFDTITYPTKIKENYDFTVKATTLFAPEGDIQYTLTFPNGYTVTQDSGEFPIRAKVLDEGVSSELVTYTITATVGETSISQSFDILIEEDTGSYKIKLLFKTSTVFGYQPQITVNGELQTATLETAIATENVTGHKASTYAWYSFYTQDDATYNQQITIEFKANRAHYYNTTYVLEVGSDDHATVDDVDYYYLAIENLNAGTDAEVYNLSHWPEAERNWTESAVNMVYNKGVDQLPVELNKNELATTSFTYKYADVADANCDGDINIKDATYIQKSLAKMVDPSTLSTTVSDVNGDGSVTIKDATAIQKQLAGL